MNIYGFEVHLSISLCIYENNADFLFLLANFYCIFFTITLLKISLQLCYTAFKQGHSLLHNFCIT